MLRAVDISSAQAGIRPSKLDCDAVIVKVCGGDWYTNPYWRSWADETLASGKLLGLYNYACETHLGTGQLSRPGGRYEAERFWSFAKEYAGEAVLILDWEADALNMGVPYAKAFLDRLHELSGVMPMFYGYASNLNTTDYSPIAKYPLWMASYLSRYEGAGWIADPYNSWRTGAWSHMTMYQYTSTGRIGGYDGRLDLSVFYGSKQDWKALEDDMSDAYDFLSAKTDATGRKKYADMRTRLAYMAEKQEKMQDSIDGLSKKLDAIAKKLDK